MNDFASDAPVDAFERSARQFLDGLLDGRPRFPVGLITPIPWAGRAAPNCLGASLEDYRKRLRIAARDYPSVRVIEVTSLVPDDPTYFVDGVHPNAKGMRTYADGIEGPLRRILDTTS